MIEYPIFVRAGDEHIAAVIALPDAEPRALIALLQGGGGATRSYHNSVWTLTARSLAERGFASLRMDWRGIGDSTGRFSMTLDNAQVDVARSVLEAVVPAVGVPHLGLAAECGGAAAVLSMAQDLGMRCESVALVKLIAARENRLQRTRSSIVGRKRVAGFVRRHVGLDRVMRRLYWRAQMSADAPVMQQLVELRRHAPVLLMSFEAAIRYESMAKVLQRRYGVGPFEVEEIPFRGRSGFPDWIARERFLVDRLPDWFDRTMSGSTPGEPAVGIDLP